MKCIKCGSDRIFKISAKCSDLCFSEYNGQEKDGYVPDGFGIGGGDYVKFKHCLNCGQIQDIFPKEEVALVESEEV